MVVHVDMLAVIMDTIIFTTTIITMRLSVIFALVTMLSATKAMHGCNSGWNAYVPSHSSDTFGIEGCDMVFDQELIKQAFPKNKCTFFSVASKNAVCMTTSATSRGTCRSDGKYGFDAQIIVKCAMGYKRWATASMATMKDGKIALDKFYFQPIV